MVLFVALASSLLFLLFGFRQGAEIQMEATVRAYCGDFDISVEEAEHPEKISLEDVAVFLQEEYGEMLEAIVPELKFRKVFVSHDSINEFGWMYGVSPAYFEINKDHISWKSGRLFREGTAEAVVESTFAKRLKLNTGDMVLARYTTDEGVINTIWLRISGIFIGNENLHGLTLFTTLDNARFLSLAEEKECGLLRVYLKNPKDDGFRSIIVNSLEEKYAGRLRVKDWKDADNQLSFVNLFHLIWLMMLLMLTVIGLVALVVVYFAIYNSFYMFYSSRNKEIATLMTFGIKAFPLFLRSFYESLLLMGGGVGLGFWGAVLVSRILRQVTITEDLATMVLVTGGPYLRISFSWTEVGVLFAFLIATGIYASLRSLHSYWRMEVREVAGHR
jgi:ABC-type lipoprotein release transport system permease subunit